MTTANIKHQASEDYFYGKDETLENLLSKYEGVFANTIKEIADGNLPKRIEPDVEITDQTFSLSKEYSSLLYFVSVTDFRNPIRKRQNDMMTDYFAKTILRTSKQFHDKMHIINKYEITSKNSIAEVLNHVDYVTQIMADLNYKLLINWTQVPFITSDYPVARYNQWLEQFGNNASSGGYASIGFQAFVPISDRLQIIIYDDQIYHIGKPRHDTVNVIREKDVTQLNILQFLNCFSNIYGNDRMTEKYVKEIQDNAKGFSRPNGVNHKNIGSIFLQTTIGLKTKMVLSFIQFTDFARSYPISNRLVYLRDHAMKVKEQRSSNQTKDTQ